jgi:hypothetical protein
MDLIVLGQIKDYEIYSDITKYDVMYFNFI